MKSLSTILSLLIFSLLTFGSISTVYADAKSAKTKSVVVVESVNVNQAGAEKISSTLKGVGLKKAQAIVDWRKAHGKFTKVSQLLEVKGIGEKTLAANKGKIKL